MSSKESTAVFVYGTLMFPEVQRAIVGQELSSASAILEGYRRSRLRGRDYPGIIASPEWQVPLS